MGFGSALGNLFGQIGSAVLPIPGVNGGALGSAIGGLLPFARGGQVPGVPGYKKGGMVKKYFQRGSKKKGKRSKKK